MFYRKMSCRVVAAVLLFALTGCSTFGPVNAKEYITSKRPPQVWVWRADSSVILVRGPHFLSASDTLVGLVEGAYQEMPLSEISQVKANRAAPLQTTALVVGSVGLAVGGAILVKKSTTSNDDVCKTTADGCDPTILYP
jgi:hypothetical protein